MDPEVARAVACKRILVFEEMLRATNFPNMDVVNELKHGAELTGCIAETGMLPGKLSPALSTVEELHANAARIRSKIVSETSGSGDSHIDSVVWSKTLEEVEKGWLLGPLQQCEVPDSHPISRRFGLLQKKGKVRLIDDYTESGVNLASPLWKLLYYIQLMWHVRYLLCGLELVKSLNLIPRW